MKAKAVCHKIWWDICVKSKSSIVSSAFADKFSSTVIVYFLVGMFIQFFWQIKLADEMALVAIFIHITQISIIFCISRIESVNLFSSSPCFDVVARSMHLYLLCIWNRIAKQNVLQLNLNNVPYSNWIKIACVNVVNLNTVAMEVKQIH